MNNNKVQNVVASSPRPLSRPSFSWATETLVLVRIVWTAFMVSQSSSVQFSRSIVSNSLQPYEQQHARLRSPSSSQTHVHWVGDAIQPSHPVAPFSCPLSSSASGSFPMRQLFTTGGKIIWVSASVLSMNIQDWYPLWLTGWISLQSKKTQESSPIPQFKSINSSVLSFLYSPTLTFIHDYWKNQSSD